MKSAAAFFISIRFNYIFIPGLLFCALWAKAHEFCMTAMVGETIKF